MPGKCLLFFKRSCPNYFDDIQPEDKVHELSIQAQGENQNYFIFQHCLASGEIRTVEVHSSPIFINEKQILFSIIHDISDRIRAEKELLENEEKFRGIYEQSPLAIEIYDVEGKLIDVNQHTLNLFGAEDKNLVLGFDLFEDPNLSAEEIAILKNGQAVSISTDFDFEVVKANNLYPTSRSGKMYMDMYAIPLRQKEEISGYLVQLIETTERKKLEESTKIAQEESTHLLELAEKSAKVLLSVVEDEKSVREEVKSLNMELEQRVLDRTAQLAEANTELEAFSYTVSHDLRAPLRAVNGFVHILEEDYGAKLDSEGKRICSVISESAEHMGLLIDNLLAFSRIGRTTMRLSLVNMVEIIDSLVIELTFSTDLERVDFEVDQLHNAIGDPKLIRQVWVNLLSNALKFSSTKERAVIKVRSERKGDEVLYSICDNGVGFDMKYVEKLFGVFQRLHAVTEFEGTGVGLAIAQRIILRHGGRIWAEGETDKGATFYFSLKGE